jgi:hypothetical protein
MRAYMEEEEAEVVPLTNELYMMLPSFLTSIHECYNCGESYKECHNIGRYRCLVHPGVRLLTNDMIPQRAFYSCCGHSLLAKGCLQIDHASFVFSETNAETRLAQIRDFATVIVPHILMRFLTRPMHSAMLYDSLKPTTRQPIFRHRFAVLGEVYERNQALLLTHKLQHEEIDWMHDERVAGHEAVSVKEFDLESESFALYKTSKESPLYSILAAQASKGKTRNTMLRECNNAWRERLGKKADEEEDDGEDAARSRFRNNRDERVHFVIIGRVNTKLDVSVGQLSI